MSLNIKALAITFGSVWGGAVLCAGLCHVIWPTYGTAFLDLVASIYPGYQVGGIGSVVVGTLYAIVDGAAGGAVIGWIYNAAAKPRQPA